MWSAAHTPLPGRNQAHRFSHHKQPEDEHVRRSLRTRVKVAG